jgi:hypothetical protein
MTGATGQLLKDKEPMMVQSFNLPPALYDRIKAASVEHGINMSELCRAALTCFLDDLEAPDVLTWFEAGHGL